MLKHQDKILNYIDNLDVFPRQTIIYGDIGSGRTSLVSHIVKNKLHIDNIQDIVSKLDVDFIDELYLNPVISAYIIYANKFDFKSQNSFLKVIEDCPSNSYFFIIAERKSQLLQTIVNRCIEMSMGNYTKKDLIDIVPDCNQYLLSICTTPGQLMSYKDVNVDELKFLQQSILKNINRACYSNVLVLADKIKFKDDDVGYDFDLFIRSFLHVIEQECVDNPSKLMYNVYNHTNNLSMDSFIPNIDKKKLFENYLLELKNEFTRTQS